MNSGGIRFIVVALIYVVLSSAQIPVTCNGPSISITTNADVSRISSCTTYNGNVIITPEATGTIDLGGIKQISGDLTCKNAAGLNGISSTTLETIGGTFDLDNLTTLKNLTFASLNRVNNISWTDLASLDGINFENGIADSNEIHISNTILKSLEDFEMTQIGTIEISNNTWLDYIVFDSLEKISKSATFASNGDTLYVDMPYLTTAGDLTFRSTWSIHVPLLSHVFGTLAFYAGTFQNISAPNLTAIENSFELSDTPLVNSISLPSLASVGGSMSILNNSALRAIGGFDQLQTIAGNVTLIGKFDSLSCPNLRDVRGDAIVKTISPNETLCDTVLALKEKIVKQSVSCTRSITTPLTNGTPSVAPTPTPTPTPTNSTSSWNSLATDARVAIILAAVLFGLSVTATIVWCFFIRPRLLRRKKVAKTKENEDIDLDVIVHGKAELSAASVPVSELSRGKQSKRLSMINTAIARPLSNFQSHPTVGSAKDETRSFVSKPVQHGTKQVESPIISPEQATPWDKYFTTFDVSNTYELYVNSRKSSPQPKRESTQGTEEHRSERSTESTVFPRPPFPSPPRIRSTIFFRPDTLFSTTRTGKSQSDC